MSEHAGHPAPRQRRRPFRAIGRFFDSVGPLLDFLGVLAGLALVINLLIRALSGEHFGMFGSTTLCNIARSEAQSCERIDDAVERCYGGASSMRAPA
ncbi:hypothetical protein EDF31_11256 [Curtobacterium sp. PhB142]|uniref:hypothetical protein n=1 Tax=unclassified Curtobacterium TaxID=257496 RepID=UPI0010442187|nr:MULTISPECIES: hypothetical protein [unclassified Curtobacterium]TCL80538.1 hypothetical protein EDF31_11256 [Curtobacterium sp. PhB142]TCL99778.1 hypothetical protein EDF26_11356 [Curtobacterium sp. PhB134]TCU43942.1 hypothetical protein EDF33_10755 [Curtobacterium sp. PhB146]TDW43075.1 hypothetical protein EDF52_11329 [Curtobacterium sp. PhB42]TDW53627.1 hypothetical protein EDF47_109139 [Curtobacterium sp. PhB190]